MYPVFRVAMLGLLLGSGTMAWAAEPLRIAPFSNRCFDGQQLVDRLRARGVSVELGVRDDRPGQAVQVLGADGVIEVRVVAHDEAGHVVGVESRRIPDGPCDALLETAELVLVRAATPLRFLPDAPRPRPKPVKRHDAPPEESAAATPEAAPVNAPVEATVESPTLPKARPVVPRPVVVESRVVTQPGAPHHPLKVELSLHGMWMFPLDSAPSTVAGDVEVALRWSRRLGVSVRAGVADHWRSHDRSGDSAATLDVRRIPIAALLELELPLRRGVVRLAAGPLVDLWRVASSGVSQPLSRLVAQPAIEARATYRLDLGRWFVEAGLGLGVAVIRQELVVTGAGALSHTPVVDLDPFVGAGVVL